VVVKRCWNFMVMVMVMETRLRSSLSSHNYRYINAGCAEIDLEVKLSSSKVENSSRAKRLCARRVFPFKTADRRVLMSKSSMPSNEPSAGIRSAWQTGGRLVGMHLAVREDNSRLGIVMGEGIE
jgi:hypothetical protein